MTTPKIRRIAVVGSFAAGAALLFAPLAVADNLTSTVDSEIASLNNLFQVETALAGVSSSDISLNSQGFDIVPPADAPVVTDPSALTPLDYELYGVNPIQAGIVGDPGSYELFNGALTEFDDAYNAALYSLLNVSNLIPSSDLFGSADTINAALATGSDAGAFTTFFDAGLSDLAGFFGIVPSI
jgi:hypothetical protein